MICTPIAFAKSPSLHWYFLFTRTQCLASSFMAESSSVGSVFVCLHQNSDCVDAVRGVWAEASASVSLEPCSFSGGGAGPAASLPGPFWRPIPGCPPQGNHPGMFICPFAVNKLDTILQYCTPYLQSYCVSNLHGKAQCSAARCPR